MTHTEEKAKMSNNNNSTIGNTTQSALVLQERCNADNTRCSIQL